MTNRQIVNETKNFIVAEAKTNDITVNKLLDKVEKEIDEDDE